MVVIQHYTATADISLPRNIFFLANTLESRPHYSSSYRAIFNKVLFQPSSLEIQ